MNLRKRTVIRAGAWSVWRGQDADTGRLVLVKEFTGTGADRAPACRRLAEEVEFLGAMDHPNLLKPVALDPSGASATFADAQCSLAGYRAWAGPLAPAQVANVLVEAAAALEHLHARRRGHACVTLDSLLVGSSGEVVLGDFLGAPLGGSPPAPDPEPKYLAPELLDSAVGRWGAPADLYGLGYAALELLAGDRFDRLFALPTGSKWLSWHGDVSKELTDWRVALPHVPTGLLDIIAGLIAKKPAARAFPTAAHLRAAVQRSGLTSGQRLAPYEGTAPVGKPAAGKRPRVGPFELRKVWHRGGRGNLYLGRWRARDGRDAAIRVFPRAFTSNPTAVRALVRGLADVERVTSRHLAEVFRAGVVSAKDGMRWYVAEEFVRGGSLRDRLTKGPLAVEDAAKMIKHVARGLAALHAVGVAHGGVEPSAVLFTRRGRAKLAGAWSVPGGASAHSAPEVRAAGQPPTPAADIYSLGAVAFEALTGRRPASPGVRSSGIDPAVPAAFRDLIAAATDPDPAARLRSPLDFVRVASMCAAGSPECSPA